MGGDAPQDPPHGLERRRPDGEHWAARGERALLLRPQLRRRAERRERRRRDHGVRPPLRQRRRARQRVRVPVSPREEPGRRPRAARAVPRVVIALDARDGFVAVDGWTQPTRVRAVDLVRAFAGAPLAGVLYTDVARDGTRVGPNVTASAELARETSVPVIASGGVGSLADLKALAAAGIAACIVGRAIYDGTFTVEEAVEAAAG